VTDKKERDDYLDPFTDRAYLKILPYENGIMIYSVEPNEIENRGMPKDIKKNYYPYNIGCAIE